MPAGSGRFRAGLRCGVAQNVYDDPDFFAAYAQLPRSVEGLDGAPEWSTLQAMLPPMAGLDVVDLGCGYGWFCRWAAAAGAGRVVGLDLSARMLERAAADTDDEHVVYERADLEQVELGVGAFDLAYSSLAFHYLVPLDRVLGRVAGALRPGGSLVFSVEHPVCTAPRRPGFVPAPDDGRPLWPLDGYLAEGPRVTDWLAPGVVKQHRTVETYLRLLHRAGFELVDLVEWSPSAAQVAAQPAWAPEAERPYFLLVSARRR